MPKDPKVWPTDLKVFGGLESEFRTGLWARNEELKCLDVSGSGVDNFPFRGARPKLSSYSDFPCPKPKSTHFFVPTGVSGQIYRTKQYFGSGRGCCCGRKPVRFGKSARNPVGTKQCVERGFGYGESEHGDSFCLAPRSKEFSPSDPETSKPLSSPFRARNPERSSDSNSSQNFGAVNQNLGPRSIDTQR